MAYNNYIQYNTNYTNKYNEKKYFNNWNSSIYFSQNV